MGTRSLLGNPWKQPDASLAPTNRTNRCWISAALRRIDCERLHRVQNADQVSLFCGVAEAAYFPSQLYELAQFSFAKSVFTDFGKMELKPSTPRLAAHLSKRNGMPLREMFSLRIISELISPKTVKRISRLVRQGKCHQTPTRCRTCPEVNAKFL